VIDSLTHVYEEEQLVVLRLYDDRERDHEQHLAILAAIAEHDPERASSLMHDHLRQVREVLAARLEESAAGRAG
jgi:GntR family transcriptional regulator, transcriptional repressor for pyruvate dehydrogenase complex